MPITSYIKQLVTISVLLPALSGCVTHGSSYAAPLAACKPGKLDTNKRPCWVNQRPDKGVVVSGAKNAAQPWKTNEHLHNQAIAELQRISGVNIRQASEVKKEVTDHAGNISQRSSSTVTTDITTDQEMSKISTQIIDEYQDPITQKVYLWVIKK